jgi:single-stranded DNA-binding protein
MNKVILSNVRLTKDATTRHIKDEATEILFSVACDRNYAPEGTQSTDFITIKTVAKSDKQLEYFVKRLLKGSVVELAGKLRIDQYEDKDQIKKQSTYIKVPITELNVTYWKAETKA